MQIIAINKDNFHFRIKVSHVGQREFAGVVIESNRTDVKVGEHSNRWLLKLFDIFDEEKVKEMDAIQNPKPEIKSILKEADLIVNGDRDVQYGNHLQAFEEYSNILESNFGIKLTPAEICKVQMAIKLGRLKYKYKRDSIVDLCGYAEILNRLENGI